MLLKQQVQGFSPSPRRLRRRLLLLAIFAIAIAGTLAVDRTSFERLRQLGRATSPLLPILRPRPAAQPTELETVFLRVDGEALAQLRKKRAEALDVGVLFTEDADWVSAWVGLDSSPQELLSAKVRLKGDWTEHVRGDRWSLRIKIRGGSRLWGMKIFSLQAPERRNGVHQWFFLQALERQGLIGLRYRFVRFFLNNKDLGTYALEEHFDRLLIENNGYREGPIIKLDEDLYWRGEAGLSTVTPRAEFDEVADILAFGRSSMESPGPDQDMFLRASGLLSGFRRGALNAGQVFDLEKLAMFHALSDLLGAQHGLAWNNVRYYFNPITSRLEPIGFDANAGERLSQTAYELKPGLRAFWQDPSFVSHYLAALETVAEPTFLEGLLEDLGQDLRSNTAILSKGVAESIVQATPWPAEIYEANRRFLEETLQPARGIRPYLQSATGRRVDLDVFNHIRFPVEIVGLECRDGRRFPSQAARILEPYDRDPPAVTRVVLETEGGCIKPEKSSVIHRVLGTSAERSEPVMPWPSPVRRVPEDLLSSSSLDPEDLARLPFLSIDLDGQGQLIRFLPGVWQLEKSLIIPPSRQLRIGPATTITLTQGASILSYSDLELEGQPDEPVVIRSDGTGGGVLVIDAGSSRLEYVRFEGLSVPTGYGWSQTGAVTFYQSPVSMRHVSFLGNRDSDDALNVVRARLDIEDCEFLDTPGDAVDVDFGSGVIRASRFLRIGGDGVDFSGSAILLEDLQFSSVTDKAISAGERSSVSFRRIAIDHAGIGIASKDESEVRGHQIELSAGGVGFSVFQKKDEYGPASIVASGQTFDQIESPFLLEQGSSLVLDSVKQTPNETHLAQRLYDEND